MLANVTIFVLVGSLDFDPLQYFSWQMYLIAALAYSALAFNGELSKNNRLIFTRRNARTIIEILTIHLGFLMIIMMLMWIAPHVFPHLPEWLTAPNIAPQWGISILDLFGILAIIIIQSIERRWLYVNSAHGSFSDESS